jgi:hypothetical protein
MIHQGLGYTVDIVMCVDISSSMMPFVGELKGNICSFSRTFRERFAERDQEVQQVRVKMIAFCSGYRTESPIVESRFFTLNDEAEEKELCAFVEALGTAKGKAQGGALEALAMAMDSEWTTVGPVRRHAILLWTDAEADRVYAGRKEQEKDIPHSIDALKEWWDGKKMQPRTERLILFAPYAEPWSEMSEWQNVFLCETKEGMGCREVDLETSATLLVNSI